MPRFIDATFRTADVVKMSESEVARLSTVLGRPSLISWLLQDVGVQAVCVTRGKGGASITTLQGTVSTRGMEIDTSPGDVVGAGDAFTAAMAHQLVRNATLQETLRAANRYAALVTTKRGAMPAFSSDDLAGIGL
jgi:fructokinase